MKLKIGWQLILPPLRQFKSKNKTNKLNLQNKKLL